MSRFRSHLLERSVRSANWPQLPLCSCEYCQSTLAEHRKFMFQNRIRKTQAHFYIRNLSYLIDEFKFYKNYCCWAAWESHLEELLITFFQASPLTNPTNIFRCIQFSYSLSFLEHNKLWQWSVHVIIMPNVLTVWKVAFRFQSSDLPTSHNRPSHSSPGPERYQYVFELINDYKINIWGGIGYDTLKLQCQQSMF